MGRDNLGDDLPPDEINVIKPDSNYGWPFCFGNQIHDNKFDPAGEQAIFCTQTVPSRVDLQAHSAPLGLAFISPSELIVAYHGSWNRSVPTGYKLMKITISPSGETQITDFITGWLTSNLEVLGRAVDVLVDEDNVYISDDKKGAIYLLGKIL